MVYFDGLYRSKKSTVYENTSYYRFLRFYADGFVLSVSSSGTPADLANWFHKDNPANSMGYYRVVGPDRDGPEEQLHFGIVSAVGVVAYTGLVKGKSLKLRYYSLANGSEGTDEFDFLKF